MNLKNPLTKINNNLIKGIVLLMFLFQIQAFSRPDYFCAETNLKTNKFYKDSTEKWLSVWTIENFRLKCENDAKYGRDIIQVKNYYGKEVIKGKRIKGFEYKTDFSPNLLSIDLFSNNVLYIQSDRKSKRKGLKYIEEFLGEYKFYKSEEQPKMIKLELNKLGENDIPEYHFLVLSYSKYTDIQSLNKLLKNIGRIYLEVRNEKSEKYFNKDYFELTKEEKLNIDMLIPIRILICPPRGVFFDSF